MPIVNPSTTNLEDPRRLKQILDEVLRRISKLEAASIPFVANQQGPLPGHMRAVQLGDTGMKANMWLNLNGQLPGQAPYQAVTDAAGTIRAELGNLAANGVSPAQFGFRANDANHNPIFDSLGLIAAASVIASETLATAVQAGSGTGWTVVQSITGTGANFTLARQGKVLTISRLSVSMLTGAQNYCAYYHAVWTGGGSLVSRQQTSAVQPAQGVNNFITAIALFDALNAGSYQFRQEFALDGATTDVGFGRGATGILPTAEVLQLGN